MKLVDSHCHLHMIDLAPYQGELSKALAHAAELGVEHFLSVSVDMQAYAELLAIAKKYKQVDISVGIHPTTEIELDPGIDELLKHAAENEVVAIGETGLDYYRCEGDMTWQQERFRRHIQVAKTLKKSLIIHTRMAREDTIRILKEEQADQVGGVMHCFTEDLAMAQAAIDLGFLISFSGIVTFKNATEIQSVAQQVPLTSMLVETDCPFLAPVPYRGKPNVPAYVRYVAEKIAELKSVSVEDVAEQTTKNYFKLFGRKSA